MNLDDRMKHYERSVGHQLTLRCPAIIRCDGRAFHTFTKGFKRPFDDLFQSLMHQTATHLCGAISTAKLAYVQSDEISILLIDYARLETDQFFGGKVQKLVSVIASEATVAFNQALFEAAQSYGHFEGYPHRDKIFKATFDARAFSVPERDVVNYFVWRQRDCIRNSIQSKGQARFSAAQLSGMSTNDVLHALRCTAETEKDPSIDWHNEAEGNKNGFLCEKSPPEISEWDWQTNPCPIFAENRNIVEQHLQPEEE